MVERRPARDEVVEGADGSAYVCRERRTADAPSRTISCGVVPHSRAADRSAGRARSTERPDERHPGLVVPGPQPIALSLPNAGTPVNTFVSQCVICDPSEGAL